MGEEFSACVLSFLEHTFYEWEREKMWVVRHCAPGIKYANYKRLNWSNSLMKLFCRKKNDRVAIVVEHWVCPYETLTDENKTFPKREHKGVWNLARQERENLTVPHHAWYQFPYFCSHCTIVYRCMADDVRNFSERYKKHT